MLAQNIRLVSVSFLVAIVLGVTACSNNQTADTTGDFPEALAQAEGLRNTAAGSNLSGNVKVDGSSTVFPVSQVMAAEFQKAILGYE